MRQLLILLLVTILHRLEPGLPGSYFEVLALRQQLAVLHRKRRRPPLRPSDRWFWLFLCRLWPSWRDALMIVTPATVIGWHRQSFRLFWTWRSRPHRGGRPRVRSEIRALIRRMSRENPLWAAPRIHGEPSKLGFRISERTVSRSMPRQPQPPSRTWRTFLDNRMSDLASMDLFVVPTAACRFLYGFVVLRHDRRQIMHVAVTAHPTAMWIARQLTDAFPWDTAPRYVLRDRDGAHGSAVRRRMVAMAITDVVTAPRSPWQSPDVERVIGSIRRECLDHVIVLGERHLRRVLASYVAYYQASRCHLALAKDAPLGRPVQSIDAGDVVAIPQVGGLHHRYERRLAA